jgi:integrase
VNRPRKQQRHLPPCVYEKHGAFWLVKAGKWTRLGTTLTEALSAYALTIETPAGGMGALIERAYAAHAPKVAKSTRAQYRLAADILKRKLAEFSPSQVKAKHVSALMDSLAGTPNMANRVRSFLSTVFGYAVKWQEVDSNPCVGLPRLEENKRTRLLTDEEWNAIHAAAGPRLRVIMELQFLTGQRISDVLSIRRSQITDEGLAFEQQKTGARLVVRWSRHLRTTLAAAEALSAGKPPALTLLRGRYNGAPDYRSVLLQWNEACRSAGVEDARLNDGRARAATAADAQGQDAQALLGHTTATHTARYLRDHKPAEVRGPKIRRR